MIEINCGQHLIQTGFRIALRNICQLNNIEEGDVVEVYIRKVE